MAYNNLQEILNEPKLRQELMAQAKTLDPGHLTKMRDFQKKESFETTRDLRDQWIYYFKLWLSDIDFSDKEEWQAKIWVPKPFSAVEQSGAIIHRALLENPDTYSIESYSPKNNLYVDRVWMPLVKMGLNNAGFVPKYVDGAKMGFITGVAGYFKLRLIDLQMPTIMPSEDVMYNMLFTPPGQTRKTFLAIDIIPPWLIYRDPESRARQNYSGTYIYHSEFKDRSFLRAMQGKGWDDEAIERILKTKGTSGKSYNNVISDDQMALYQLKQYHHNPSVMRRPYLVDEFWGDILDENGDVVMPDALMILSGKEVVFGPVENPLWGIDESTGRKKWPLIAGAPLIHPLRFEGRGIIEQTAPFANLYSNLFMLTADGMNWKVNPSSEVYQNALADPDDLEVRPGKLWAKHSKETAFQPANIVDLDIGGILNFMQFADRERQNNDFTTDFAIGLPGARSEITKGEVQIKTSQSLAIFEMMNRNLETTGKDLVELVFDFAVQFSDPITNPQLADVLDPEALVWLATLDAPARQEILRGNYIYTFTGLSQALQKADHLNRMTQLLTIVASPQYSSYVNPSQVLSTYVDLLGVRNRIDVFPQQMVSVQQAQQMIQQAMQQTLMAAKANPALLDAPMPGGPQPSSGGPPPGQPPMSPAQGQPPQNPVPEPQATGPGQDYRQLNSNPQMGM